MNGQDFVGPSPGLRFTYYAAPASSNPNLIPSPNTVPNPDPDPNPNPKQAAPASSWLSTSSSFPRNVLRRVSDALGGSERDLGVN